MGLLLKLRKENTVRLLNGGKQLTKGYNKFR